MLIVNKFLSTISLLFYDIANFSASIFRSRVISLKMEYYKYLGEQARQDFMISLDYICFIIYLFYIKV